VLGYVIIIIIIIINENRGIYVEEFILEEVLQV
jgi:hypothetical protein